MANSLALNGLVGNPYLSQQLTQSYVNTTGLASYLDDSAGFSGNINNALFDGLGTLKSNPYGGMYGGMGLGGMYGGMGYGMNPTQYMQYQREMALGNAQLQGELENINITRQVARSQKQVAAEFQVTAASKAVKEQLEILNRQINENNQDNVSAAYRNLRSAVETEIKQGGYVTGSVNEEFVKARANDLYRQTYGQDIPQSLIQNGDSAFVHGAKQGFLGLGWLVTNNKSRAQNVSEITGEKVTTGEKAMRWLGAGLSAAVTLTAACLLLKKGGGIGSLTKLYRETKLSKQVSKLETLAKKSGDDCTDQIQDLQEQMTNYQKAQAQKAFNKGAEKFKKQMSKLS